jgi:hypothetical protein
MTDDPTSNDVPASWLEALAKSEAELDAGLTVPGHVVRQDLLDSLARMKAKRDQPLKRGAAQRR